MYTDVETFIARARELRAAADAAERDFLLFLVDGERHPKMWQASGSVTYDGFLKAAGLCCPARYRNFKASLESAPELTKGVGAAAAVQAGKLAQDSERIELLREAKSWEETNGTSISDQSARGLAAGIRARSATRRAGHASYSTLVEKLAHARATIEKLQHQLELERTEKRALQAQLAGLTAKKRRGGHRGDRAAA